MGEGDRMHKHIFGRPKQGPKRPPSLVAFGGSGLRGRGRRTGVLEGDVGVVGRPREERLARERFGEHAPRLQRTSPVSGRRRPPPAETSPPDTHLLDGCVVVQGRVRAPADAQIRGRLGAALEVHLVSRLQRSKDINTPQSMDFPLPLARSRVNAYLVEVEVEEDRGLVLPLEEEPPGGVLKVPLGVRPRRDEVDQICEGERGQ